MSLSQPAFRQSREPHLHLAGQACPVCDQPIPNEMAEAVRARLEARDKRLADAALARAAEKFAAEKAQLELANRDTVELIRREGADAIAKVRGETAGLVATAREQAKQEADAAAQTKITALEDQIRNREVDWQGK